MRDLAVVALEEVLADDLPVRLDLRLPALVEDELVDVEPELCDLRGHRAERLGERLRVALRVHEEERPPRVDGDAAEAELARREVGELLRARRAPERAVEPVRPRVVGALDRLALARPLGDREAAVPADVQEGAQLAVARARDDDRRAARARRRVRAGLRQLAEMPGVLPRRAEDALLLAAQDLRVAVPAVRERFLHLANVSRRTMLVWTQRGAPTATSRSTRGSSSPCRRSSSRFSSASSAGRCEAPSRTPATTSATPTRCSSRWPASPRRLLPRLRVRLDAHPRRLGSPHLVSRGPSRRDGLDAREVRAGRRVDAGGARRRRAPRRDHGRRARHRLDPRRGRDLRRRRRDRVRRLAPLDGSGRCADRPDHPLRGRRVGAAASEGVLPACIAGAAEARPRVAAAACASRRWRFFSSSIARPG